MKVASLVLIIVAALLVIVIPVTSMDWQSEIVNMSQIGFQNFPAMKLDKSDTPHIFFTYQESHPGNPYANYGYKEGSGWYITNLGYGTSGPIALDSNNHPHLFWRDWNSGSGMYTFWDGSGWQSQLLFELAGGAICADDLSSCDLEVDSYNKVHAIYVKRNGPLQYAVTNETGWFNHTHVETIYGTGYRAALALDSSNRPHILYTSPYFPYIVNYTYKDNLGNWHDEQIDSVCSEYKVDIAIDSEGYPHVVYNNFTDYGHIRYAYKDETGWHIEQLDMWGFFYSIVLDSDDNPRFTHCGAYGLNSPLNGLNYAYKDGSGWHLVNPDPSYGANSALDLDRSNMPHILSFFDSDDGTGSLVLKYYTSIQPPASVTNLRNITYASNYINWTWTDPADADFNRVMVYLNGTFKTNVSKGTRYYLATGLTPNTQYTLGTHTVDNAGNVNQTWVNHTSRTAAVIQNEYGRGVFRPSVWSNWILDRSMDGGIDVRDHYGSSTDKPLIADFNSDGKADRALFRSGEWIIDYNMDGSINSRPRYGQAGDIPLVGRMNADGITDRAVFRNGEWIIDYGMDGSVNARNNYGTAGDIPLIGDFNNDYTPDRAVFRPSSTSNNWIIDYGMNGIVDVRNRFGQNGDIPLIGDFNADGITDRAVFRAGEWIIDYSMNGSIDARPRFGQAGDIPLVWNL